MDSLFWILWLAFCAVLGWFSAPLGDKLGVSPGWSITIATLLVAILGFFIFH